MSIPQTQPWPLLPQHVDAGIWAGLVLFVGVKWIVVDLVDVKSLRDGER